MRTSLYSRHIRLGAKMVPFAGWEMPVKYAEVIEEHRTVREKAGLFDVSHMGEIEVRGPNSARNLQYLISNDVGELEVGQVQYGLLCNETGGIQDDLTVYRLASDHYLLVVNAARAESDFQWIRRHLREEAEVSDRSAEYGLLALQGPKAEQILAPLADIDVVAVPYYHFARARVDGAEVLVSRTGYTGEDGYELYLQSEETPQVWDALLDQGARTGLRPIGLGARDTLRLEMKYALYGNDIDESTNPIEAGLGWVVKLEKGDFLGREAILRVKEAGPHRKLVGIAMVGRGIPRSGYGIYRDGEEVGRVTSGTLSPTLGKGIGLAYVRADMAGIGTGVEVDVRGKRFRAEVVRTPFFPSRVKR